MHAINTSSCGTSNVSSTQPSGRSHGSPQQRADSLVRATVMGDLGQDTGQNVRNRGTSTVQSIATALRDVLAKSDSTGTDLPDELLQKIETSLTKAAQALADRGYDASTIDATIDKFRSQLANALDSLGSDAASTSTPSQNDGMTVQKYVAREVQKQKTSLDIITTEGDRVSIRLRTKEISNSSVTAVQQADGTTAIAAGTSVVSRGRLQVELDGDLNEEELAAIGDLLTKVNDIADKFFSGDVQAAFAAATELGVDSDQIAAYQLDLTYSRKSAVAVYRSTRESVPVQLPATGTQSTSGSTQSAAPGAQPPSPSTTAATSGSTAADSTATTDSTTTSARSTATTDSATAPTGSAATTTGTEATPATAQKTIADFIGTVLSKLGSAAGAGRLNFSMTWKVQVLISGLSNSTATAPSTTTALLGDVLNKVAA